MPDDGAHCAAGADRHCDVARLDRVDADVRQHAVVGADDERRCGTESEIRRELRLLSFDADTRFPISDELAELTLQVESERRLARGVDLLNEAIAQDKPSVDLEYHVPATAPATMQRMHEVMLRADRFCRDQSLLTVAATPQQLQLMEWYAGEFVRQGRGEEPLPWPGSTEVEPSTR